jgi:hypothetical protein
MKRKQKYYFREELKMAIKHVKFIKPLEGYRIGDVANWDETIADKVIAQSYAVEVQPATTVIIEEKAKK